MTPRKIAFDVLRRVEEGAFSDLALDAALAKLPALDPRDKGLVTELVYGVLRYRGRLDFALSQFSRKPLQKIEKKVLVLLRIGIYQLLMLDRIPARAAVHETVELARGEGMERATGFINGILRSVIRDQEKISWPDPQVFPQQHLEHVLSLPRWLASRWLREFGARKSMALAEAMLQPPPFTLRVNTLRISRDEFLERLQQAGHQAIPTTYAPEGVIVLCRGEAPLPGDKEGWYQVQDEASMLIAHLLDPQPGERVLDACSAPGGKTTHMSALAGGEASILALDLHPKRVNLVTNGAARLGCQGIEARPWDLSFAPNFLEPESFDKVLVDAPCSGLGVLRRNPEIRWRRREADLKALAGQQSVILGNVASLVRPGGTLLYSLCTFTAEETEGVIKGFLSSFPSFEVESLRDASPSQWSELFDSRGALCTFPDCHGGMDAFYAVRLRRSV